MGQHTKNILVAVEGRRWLAIPLVLLGFVQLWTPLLALALGVANADGGVLPASLLDYKKFTVEPNPFQPVA